MQNKNMGKLAVVGTDTEGHSGQGCKVATTYPEPRKKQPNNICNFLKV